MKNESVKKSLEKSKNVLEEKKKMSSEKSHVFTIIAMNFVQEQLKTRPRMDYESIGKIM